jgi:hypothetical protein
VPEGDSWRVVGPESAQAVVAYAALEGSRVVYTLAGAAVGAG